MILRIFTQRTAVDVEPMEDDGVVRAQQVAPLPRSAGGVVRSRSSAALPCCTRAPSPLPQTGVQGRGGLATSVHGRGYGVVDAASICRMASASVIGFHPCHFAQTQIESGVVGSGM